MCRRTLGWYKMMPFHSLFQIALLAKATTAAIWASTKPSFTSPHEDRANEYFRWDAIQASTNLRYHECYGSFECARLEVPLDWSNLSNPNRVSLAIVRLPAVVDVTDERFGGTIVINPGGPGGSGVDLILQAGRGAQRIVDSGDKHFEILSFDPRGIKFSTPSTACFEDDATRDMLSFLGVGSGSLEANPNALNVKWGIDRGLGQLCEQARNGRFDDGSNIHQYVSTALVVQDMVEIVDQVDAHLRQELRQKRTGAASRGHQITVLPDHADDDEIPLLNYWGLSYGTYLGNSFASMFPERIGRMVLDGVVDADDYAATGWTTNLQDNNKTWAKFFEFCFEAGPRCALIDDVSAKEPRDLQDKVERFLAGLKDDPLPLIVRGNLYLLTYFELKANIHVALYFPNDFWPALALSLQSLITIGGAAAAANSSTAGMSVSDMAELWQQPWPPSSRGFAPSLPFHQQFRRRPTSPGQYDDVGAAAAPPSSSYAWHMEAGVSILCGDGDDITSHSKADFAQYLSLLESQSPLVGSIWAEIALYCVHWPASLRPTHPNRFTGPFRSNLSDYDPRASPLLFIGNTADPVTPLRNALKMSGRHEGSVVLTQDVPGHCAGDINPSLCTFDVVKSFFGNGTLPKPGLVCEGSRKPWDA